MVGEEDLKWKTKPVLQAPVALRKDLADGVEEGITLYPSTSIALSVLHLLHVLCYRREEEEMIQVDDVDLVISPEGVDVRRHSAERRRGRGRPPKPRSHLFVHDELVSGHHDLLRGVSPSTGAVTGQSSPGMAEYEDEDDEDEVEMKVSAAAYGATDFGDDEGLLSPSDESPGTLKHTNALLMILNLCTECRD